MNLKLTRYLKSLNINIVLLLFVFIVSTFTMYNLFRMTGDWNNEQKERENSLANKETLLRQLKPGDEFVAVFDDLNNRKYCNRFFSYMREENGRSIVVISQHRNGSKSRTRFFGWPDEYLELGCPENGVRLDF